MDSNEERFTQIIKQQSWLMNALRDVRSLRLPDWYIAAGAVRNTVWNYLNGCSTTSNQKDVDVVYFDKSHLNLRRDLEIYQTLKRINPDLDWDVTNQARKNSKDLVAESSCQSIAYWSETPTCIGVRLEDNDNLNICAPHGLDDLMNLIVRPVPESYQRLSLYRERISEKNWKKIWPRLKIEKH